jgi:hypothetical protein
MAPGADPAAGALPLDHLMLGDLGFHRRDLHDLPPLGARLRRAIQASTAPGATSRLVPDHMIGMTGQLHRLARLPLRPTGPAAGVLAQRLQRGLEQPVRRRRLRGVLRARLHARGKVSYLRLQLTQLGVQRGDLRVLCLDNLPQPGVGSTRSATTSPDTGGVSDTCRTPPQPTRRNLHDTPSRPAGITQPRQLRRDLSSYRHLIQARLSYSLFAA